MRKNTLAVPSIADIAAIFSTEILDPLFDDAEVELLEINRFWDHYQNDVREAA